MPRCRAISGAVKGMEYLGTALAKISRSIADGAMPASARASRAALAASSSCVSVSQTNRSLTPQLASSQPSGFSSSRSRAAELTFFLGRLVHVASADVAATRREHASCETLGPLHVDLGTSY